MESDHQPWRRWFEISHSMTEGYSKLSLYDYWTVCDQPNWFLHAVMHNHTFACVAVFDGAFFSFTLSLFFLDYLSPLLCSADALHTVLFSPCQFGGPSVVFAGDRPVIFPLLIHFSLSIKRWKMDARETQDEHERRHESMWERCERMW